MLFRNNQRLYFAPDTEKSEGVDMPNQAQTSAILALAAGILVLLKPKLLNYVVAAYLITDGATRLLGRRA